MLTSKLPHVGTTIFTVMSQMAQECGALNLSQGFPDFEPPAELLERVTHYLHQGKNQYAPMPGVPELRYAIARKLQRCYQTNVNPEQEITVTSGATEALFSAIQAVVKPGDEVIVFDPAYDSYEPAVTLAGGDTVHIPMLAPDFAIDWQRVRDAITPRTRMIILNSPHNPTGAVVSADDLQQLSDAVRDTDIILLSDEVYEHILFDQHTHLSMLTHPELRQRSLVVSSFGKTYHATGWKIGYVIAPAELTAEFRKVHQFNQFVVVSPMQYALADYLDSAPEHYLGLSEFYEQKRDYFCDAIKGSRFSFRKTAGTYFQILDYSAISDEPDTVFAETLTRTHGLAAIPVSVFYETVPEQYLLRFCFAKDETTLDKAAEILCRI